MDAPAADALHFAGVERVEDYLAQVAGRCRLRPIKSTALSGTVRVARLRRVATLSFDTDPMHAAIPPAHGFYGVTIADGSEFAVRDGLRWRDYDRSTAHLLEPEQPFDFRSRGSRMQVLGTNFFVDLEVQAERLGEALNGLDGRIALDSPEGAAFQRYLRFAREKV
jgi:hypothetical protein